MKIKILATGGTFDKEYNEITGELFFKNTHIKEMLELGRSKLNIDLEVVMLMDSLFMEDKHRKEILEKCNQSKEDKIVITHGTDGMVETAKEISKEITDKTIVLTGAMIPYKFGSSDGLFNLGSALSFVQVLPPGVYIAMNGRILDPNKAFKNKELGIFEEKE